MPLNRICHITTAHPPFDVRIFHKECRSLAHAGYKLSVVVPHNRNDIVNGIEILAIGRVKSRPRRMIISLPAAFRRALKQRSDLYHLHDPELLPFGLLLKLLTRKRIVYDVHEDYPSQALSKKYIPQFMRSLLAHLIRIVEAVSSRYFDGIIAATDTILSPFSFHSRAVTVKNFPRLSYYATSDNQEKDRPFRVVYIGVIAEIRGISKIIRAMDYLPQHLRIKLVLCGTFDPKDYESEIKHLPGYTKVQSLNWIEQTQYPTY